jgi:hypothetical protein
MLCATAADGASPSYIHKTTVRKVMQADE